MRFRLWVVIPLLLSQSIASAQEASHWVKFISEDRSTIYIDTSYFLRNANLTTVRTYEQLNAIDAQGSSQKIITYRFDCDRKLATIESVTRYDANNQLISHTNNDQVDKLIPFAKKSVFGSIYKYACEISH